MADSDLPIVLYHYPFSPYARRVVWYLALRGIPYKQCIQPPTMPRPDLAELGIKHRRIPVMVIGRDVYLDTRLILAKLEDAHRSIPRLGASDPQSKGVERLLASLTLDTDVFLTAMRLLSEAKLPLLKDPGFQKDRADFVTTPPGGWTSKAEAVHRFRQVMQVLETTLLADGRDWILNTPKPSLADIEAVWPFHWLVTLPQQALPPDQISAAAFPRVFAWIDRFDRAYAHAVNHRDVGRLVGLDHDEIVIETTLAGGGAAGVRLHAPRHGFRVRPVAGKEAGRL
ncbi:hypothetical protein MAPG_05501 [Magnaporthiopsis poae ATCC 64411]|uniref:GST N-terminal domain-containing protein n=1 Tax=Magnaporthiopsis poae (strain ATCC 64411 / 73-15) TaxID=644358 RepID=A0A0C4DZJ9_MAGP6|nr:hypothetical protein MAPG_05501 [Magnaporthiopsis poae ATCC 64411]